MHVTSHIHDGVFYVIRIRHLVKEKALLFAGALDVDVAVTENRREEPVYFACCILDSEEEYLAHAPHEKPPLFDIDDALIGDDPDVEVVVDPHEEAEKPEKNKEGAFDERKESSIDVS